MKRSPVKSSNIAEVGYDMPTLTLEVEFKNKSVYQYWPIKRSMYDSLVNAKSVGKYFNKHIRNVQGINFMRIG